MNQTIRKLTPKLYNKRKTKIKNTIKITTNQNPIPQASNHKQQTAKPVNQNQQINIKITSNQTQATTIQHNMHSHINTQS